jgi:5'-methylthioadenosine phosphorylase
MKLLNVKNLISINAVGSLKEEIVPTSLVIPDQFIDHTTKRESTFFGNGLVAHVSMAEPTCPSLSHTAFQAAGVVGLDAHSGGTYLNIEGPQFSTLAESELYRKSQCSVIGMTQAIEAKLARELEMCFVSLSFVTDYDCWHRDSDSVSVEMIVENLGKNAESASRLISLLIDRLDKEESVCNCHCSLKNAFITDPEKIPMETKMKLAPVIGKYIPLE